MLVWVAPNWVPGALNVVTSFNTRTGAVVPEAGDYNAKQVDYDPSASSLTSTTVQDAIDDLDGLLDQKRDKFATIQTVSTNTTLTDSDVNNLIRVSGDVQITINQADTTLGWSAQILNVGTGTVSFGSDITIFNDTTLSGGESAVLVRTDLNDYTVIEIVQSPILEDRFDISQLRPTTIRYFYNVLEFIEGNFDANVLSEVAYSVSTDRKTWTTPTTDITDLNATIATYVDTSWYLQAGGSYITSLDFDYISGEGADVTIQGGFPVAALQGETRGISTEDDTGIEVRYRRL